MWLYAARDGYLKGLNGFPSVSWDHIYEMTQFLPALSKENADVVKYNAIQLVCIMAEYRQESQKFLEEPLRVPKVRAGGISKAQDSQK